MPLAISTRRRYNTNGIRSGRRKGWIGLKTNLIAHITREMPGFSKGQKRIAHYILEHYDTAAFMTAYRLGETVGVSESTVVRFAAELGFEGYPQLQKAMQELIRSKLTSVQRVEVTRARMGDSEVLDNVMAYDMQNIRQTLEELPRDVFDRAVDALVSARKVYIFGAGSCRALANFAAYYLKLLLPDIHLVYTSSETEILEELIHISEEDTILGMSFPRDSSKAVSHRGFCHLPASGPQRHGHHRRLARGAAERAQRADRGGVAPPDGAEPGDAQRARRAVGDLSGIPAVRKNGGRGVKVRSMESDRPVIVVGGGAAGLMAAGCAGRRGRPVTVVERNPRPARKVLITGKGRCNVTNNCTAEDAVAHVPGGGRFLYSAFSAFTPQDCMALFEEQGVPLKTERGGRVFPESDKAMDIADALARYARTGGARIRQGRVSELLIADGACRGVRLEDGSVLEAGAVIVCTGGLSYPLTGSTGDGYALARQAGHTVTPLRPSLVPLEAEDGWCAALQGLSLKNAGLTVRDEAGQKTIYRDFGEMLFTHFGLSGPMILSASAHLRHMARGRYTVHIDLKPALTPEQLDSRLVRDLRAEQNRAFGTLLGGLLPRSMVPVMAELCGVPPERKCHSVTREERAGLLRLLKDLPVRIAGFRPVEEAIVTAGGVALKEIDAKTMASKKLPGLFFAGEVLDLDAYTGGFNLQIAFATGQAAGRAV